MRDLLSKETLNFHVDKSFQVLLQRHPDFKVRYLNGSSPVKLIIKHDEEVILTTETKIFQQPFLWTDNLVLVQIIQQLYNEVRQKSS